MSDDASHLAAGLATELGPLRRAMLRATRHAEGLPDLPENQIEVLRVAAGAPGVTTTALSQTLHLARPTVSNLLNTMRREKLVELRRRTDDARIVEVHLSARARGLLQRYDATSTALMQKALEQLDVDQRAAVAAALPALSRLREFLGGQGR